MAAKPNPDMDERIAIPLDPELAIGALLRVDPDGPPAEDDAQADEKQRKSSAASEPPGT
jgi:hypothetical protein